MILLLFSAATADSSTLTPCQRCCQPGGDCSAAYKNTPGKCCGTANGQAFCCPGMIDGAKCYNCGSAYRCYTGLTSRNICGSSAIGPSSHHHHSSPHHHYSEQGEQSSMGLVLMIGIGIVLGAIFCARRQHDYHAESPAYNTMMPQGKPMAYGAPVGGYAPQGVYAPQMMHGGMPGYGYGGGGYSGTAVAGSAAAGFLGGMLVNEAMSHHGGHDHHHYGGSDYGSGYSSGGDYGGGGGGDSGFAADS